jgi:Ala-tRNA(Pro) deacylase
MPCEKLLEYLNEREVSYHLIVHPQAYTAQEIADRAHISGKFFAKTVMLIVDGEMAMAVLPADRRVNMALLKEATGAQKIWLATEDNFREKFPDCELGAMPPFGNLYGMEVYVAGSLAEQDEIAFNAGTHTELIAMAYADFESLVAPRVARFSFHPLRELAGES